jgi:hypothetical protein
MLTDVVNDAMSDAFSRQAFTGDGSETDFTLSKAPATENDLIVFIEGVFQTQSAYSVSGTTLTFSSAPANSREIIVYHITAAVNGDSLSQNNFTGDGSDTTFTLSVDPLHENNTMVFLDGVYQHKATYSVSGTTLTFDTAPANGVLIECITHTQTEVNTPSSNSVVTASIVDDNVTQAKLADDAVGADQLASSAVVTASIVDDNVTQAKIADDAVGADQLASSAVVTASVVDDAITTAKIADDQITLAKMAGLARGKIIYGDSSGNPAALTVGSNGQVLKSDGTDISWGTDATVAALTSEEVQDIAGAMFTSNTETGITATYEDGDGTIDLVVGTLNQNTTGSAATLTTARTIAMTGDVVWSSGSFDGSGNVTAAATIQTDAVDIAMLSATGTASSSTFLRGDNSWAAAGADFDTAITINESGADVDFRVESNDFSHALFVDGGNNRVGIGEIILPTSILEVSQNVSAGSGINSLLTLSAVDGGVNMSGGEGVGILFRIPDDETNPSVGAQIGALKESADDSISSTALVFSVSQNDETLDEALRIDSAGLVGIGTASPSTMLHLNHATDVATRWSTTSGSTYSFQIGQYYTTWQGLVHPNIWQPIEGGGSSDICITTATNTATAGIVIDAGTGGNVGIGIINPSTKLHVNGTSRFTNTMIIESAGSIQFEAGHYHTFKRSGNTTILVRADTAATIGTFAESGAYSSSDLRYKENITTITGATEKVKQLRGITHTWKEPMQDSDNPNQVGYGLIAQEVETVIPEVVITDNSEEGYKSINYEKLVPLLIETIKELEARLTELEDN